MQPQRMQFARENPKPASDISAKDAAELICNRNKNNKAERRKR